MNQICNRTHHNKSGNQEIRVALGAMTRGAKDKEDGRIQKSGSGEDDRGVRMSKTRRGEKGKGNKEARRVKTRAGSMKATQIT